MSKLIFAGILAAPFLFPNFSHANSVSLQQDLRDIVCELKDGAAQINSLLIDKKDYVLTLKDKSSKTSEFKQVKFLDRGLLAVSAADTDLHLFIHVLPAGEAILTLGTLLSFRESDCEDTGASKACKTPALIELLWTPEKIKVKAAKHSVNADVSRYGFFPSHATFSYGREKSKGKAGFPAALIVDFGSQIQLLVGHSSLMKCHY